MSIQIIQLDKHTRFPKCDLLVEHFVDFEKLYPHLQPKLRGNWTIVFVGIGVDVIKNIKENYVVGEYVNILCYVNKDVLDRAMLMFKDIQEDKLTKWEKYIEIIKTTKLSMNNKILRELYRRAQGNTDKIEEVINSLEKKYGESAEIKIKELNSVIIKDESVYARDVVLTLLLKNNSNIKRKGSRYSIYKYKDLNKVTQSLIDSLGRKYAYYAIRKYIRDLFVEKDNYLLNKEVKNAEVVKYVDAYEILHLKLLFEAGNPDMLEACLYIHERRRFNDCLFRKTFNSSISKYYYS